MLPSTVSYLSVEAMTLPETLAVAFVMLIVLAGRWLDWSLMVYKKILQGLISTALNTDVRVD